MKPLLIASIALIFALVACDSIMQEEPEDAVEYYARIMREADEREREGDCWYEGEQILYVERDGWEHSLQYYKDTSFPYAVCGFVMDRSELQTHDKLCHRSIEGLRWDNADCETITLVVDGYGTENEDLGEFVAFNYHTIEAVHSQKNPRPERVVFLLSTIDPNQDWDWILQSPLWEK